MAVLRRLPAVLLLALAAVPGAPRAQVAGEYDVKAAFLYNFTKFVEWPPTAFFDERSALNLCVLGEDPFGRSLPEIVGEGEEVAGRRLTLVRMGELADPTVCHVLFVSRSERNRLPRILAAVGSFPVLTVGDTPGFLNQGGIVNFTLEGSKVRFEISQTAAERAGIKISSKLLRLAKRVAGGARPGP